MSSVSSVRSSALYIFSSCASSSMESWSEFSLPLRPWIDSALRIARSSSRKRVRSSALRWASRFMPAWWSWVACSRRLSSSTSRRTFASAISRSRRARPTCSCCRRPLSTTSTWPASTGPGLTASSTSTSPPRACGRQAISAGSTGSKAPPSSTTTAKRPRSTDQALGLRLGGSRLLLRGLGRLRRRAWAPPSREPAASEPSRWASRPGRVSAARPPRWRRARGPARGRGRRGAR